jgi:hypothetical protein
MAILFYFDVITIVRAGVLGRANLWWDGRESRQEE